MTAIDFGMHPILAASVISADMRREAWRIAIAQAATLEAVKALEQRLYRRMRLLRDREQTCGVEREALWLCAQRRAEIAAAAAMPPGASRHDQAAPIAQGVQDD